MIKNAAEVECNPLGVNITGIFEIFNVNEFTTISVNDVTVALRMLGIDINKDTYRKDILPHYTVKNERLSVEAFKQLYLDLKQNPEYHATADCVFSDLDADQTGLFVFLFPFSKKNKKKTLFSDILVKTQV